MGAISKEIEVGSPDGFRYKQISVLVDTGASITAVPTSMLEELGINPHDQ